MVMGVAWVPITVVAARSQTARNALQRDTDADQQAATGARLYGL